MDQYWSWILTAVGVSGFILAGRKVWWCWYINIACQGLWITYAIVTKQWGFIVAALIYTVVFTQNAVKWTKEHRTKDDDVYHWGFLQDYAKADVEATEWMLEKYNSGVRKDDCLGDGCNRWPLSCGYCMAHCQCEVSS